ncbi:MAG: DUF2079 domain-containing protein [Ktedonobacterales bacterium]
MGELTAPETESSSVRIQRPETHWLRRQPAYLLSFTSRLRIAWLVVVLAIVLFTVLVGMHSIVRQQSYHTDAFDMGNMDQAVWNTLHGHLFRFTNRGADWEGPPTRLGIHVEPILLLIALFYLIHSGPETLLVLQTVALALGAMPLFLLGRRRIPQLPLATAALACAYLVAPALLGAALWDFHAVALATPLLLLAVWALDGRRYWVFALAAFLAAMTKEDVALALIPLGIYIALRGGKPRYGAAVVLLSAVWVLLCFFVILPHFNGGVSGGNNYWYRYAWAGATVGDAIKNLAIHPWLLVAFVLKSPPRLGYIATLLRIGGGLGIFAPALWICALPELAVNLYSSHPEQYSGVFQYNAVIVAFLSAASVYGVEAVHSAALRKSQPANPGQKSTSTSIVSQISARWQEALEHLPVPSKWIGPLVIGWLIVTCYWNLASADYRLLNFWNAGNGPVPYQSAVDALLARIPESASVAATDTLDPHLSDRYDLYLLPDPESFQAQYVAFDIPHAVQSSQAQDQQIYREMITSGRYAVVGTVAYKNGEVVVLHRTGPPLDESGHTKSTSPYPLESGPTSLKQMLLKRQAMANMRARPVDALDW